MIVGVLIFLCLCGIGLSYAGMIAGHYLTCHEKRLTELEREIQRITKEMK